MPELPEVETVRRVMERVLVAKRIREVELPEDPYLLQKRPAEPFREILDGAYVQGVGRKGKTWWLELEGRGFVLGHLGMAGWIREMGAETIRLKEHGNAPLDDETGRPRFLRLMLTAEDGRRIAFTDGRRLGRLWMADSLESDPKLCKLGRDAWSDLPSVQEIAKWLCTRKAPIKALLLDQAFMSGIGNWIADEVLFHARIAPMRTGQSLQPKEIEALREQIVLVIDHSVQSGADETKYPDDWLFHVRWGGSKGTETHLGHALVREEVGGRTTAWVPALQK